MHLHTNIHLSFGGMEKQSYELIKGLSAYYSTHVIAYQGNENKIVSLVSKTQIESQSGSEKQSNYKTDPPE